MRKLFDRFEELSEKAQELLEKGIGQMRDGFAPDPDLCQDITTALSSLRAAYDEIRRELPEHILAEELPEGDLLYAHMRKHGKTVCSAKRKQFVMCWRSSSAFILMKKVHGCNRSIHP